LFSVIITIIIISGQACCVWLHVRFTGALLLLLLLLLLLRALQLLRAPARKANKYRGAADMPTQANATSPSISSGESGT
jgi:hypothetical protein